MFAFLNFVDKTYKTEAWNPVICEFENQSLVFFSDRLFEWLVAFINNSMCADNSKWCNFIGI